MRKGRYNMARAKRARAADATAVNQLLTAYIEFPFGSPFDLEHFGYVVSGRREGPVSVRSAEDPDVMVPADRITWDAHTEYHVHHCEHVAPGSPWQWPPGLIEVDPLTDTDKALFSQIGTAEWDPIEGRFEPNSKALLDYLRDEMGVVRSRLGHLRWAEIIADIRRHRGEAVKADDNRHHESFSSVRWNGVSYKFSPMQARAVAVLTRTFHNNTPGVLQTHIFEEIESNSDKQRLRDLFKSHPAWGTMIVKVRDRKGMYQLAPP